LHYVQNPSMGRGPTTSTYGFPAAFQGLGQCREKANIVA
jgi:hypothetical protein